MTGDGYRVRVKRIVIAGGIGAGKSAATDFLAGLGYEIIDADDVAHAVTEPGAPAWHALRDAFGDAVLDDDGQLDRHFVADVVFHDPSALRRLNLITHAHIGEEMRRRLDLANGECVFLAVPLFRAEHRSTLSLDEVWAVQSSPELAESRLVTYRGFTSGDARARLSSQMSNEERAKIVDVVIWNDGTLDELHAQLNTQLERIGLHHG